MRPIIRDAKGIIRFQAHPIVVKLFEHTIATGLDLKALKAMRPKFSTAEWEEFLQLIGWPVSSYCASELVSPRAAMAAQGRAHLLFPDSI
jgi:hypothetical protein